MKKKLIVFIIIILLILLIAKGFTLTRVGGAGFEVDTIHFGDSQIDEIGRHVTGNGSYSRIGAIKEVIHVTGTLSAGELEYVFFDGKTGLELTRKKFTEPGTIDFFYETDKKTDGIEYTQYFTDTTAFVGEIDIDLYNYDYKTWIATY